MSLFLFYDAIQNENINASNSYPIPVGRSLLEIENWEDLPHGDRNNEGMSLGNDKLATADNKSSGGIIDDYKWPNVLLFYF